MADTNNTERAQWKFNALYADTEVRRVSDDKLLAVVHAGPEQSRIVSLLKGAPQPNAALADGWQDIASAPKDGTTVLLWEQYSDAPVLGFYSERRGKWFADTEHYDTSGDAYVIDKLSQDLITHWQPAPAPATLNASKGEQP